MKLLVRLRRERGLSQDQLARGVGHVHAAWVSAVERGVYVPSSGSAAARRLSKFFGRSLAELLAEVEAADGERVPVGIGAAQNGAKS